MGSNAAPSRDRLLAAAAAMPADLRTDRPAPTRAGSGPPLHGGSVYTDDKAPVEWLVDKSLLDYAGGDERPDDGCPRRSCRATRRRSHTSGGRASSTTTARRWPAGGRLRRLCASGPASTWGATRSAVRDGGALVAVGAPAAGAHAFVYVLPAHRGRGIGSLAAAAGRSEAGLARGPHPASRQPCRRTSTPAGRCWRPPGTSAAWRTGTSISSSSASPIHRRSPPGYALRGLRLRARRA